MALMESVDIPLGTQMPDFTLPDPDGVEHRGADLYGDKGLLLVVTCNHCPYAKALWPRLIRLAHDVKAKGIETVAVNPNINPEYPDDRPELMRDRIKEWRIPFPYLVDETQDVARALQAQCTPDLYLYDAGRKLVYHGRFDDNWQDEAAVKQHDLAVAIDHLVKGEPVPAKQVPSMGCSIKWRES